MPKGFGATVNVAKPKKGSSVAIFGLGAVGLAVSCSYFFFIPVIQLIRRIVLMFLLQFRLQKVQEFQGLQGSLELI